MKITKSILKKIIKEEILRESLAVNEAIQKLRQLALNPKKLTNIKKAYSIVKKIKKQEPEKGSVAYDYFISKFGEVGLKIAEHLAARWSKNKQAILDLSGEDLRGYDFENLHNNRTILIFKASEPPRESVGNVPPEQRRIWPGRTYAAGYPVINHPSAKLAKLVNFSNANMQGAVLDRAYLQYGSLEGANLNNASMLNAQFNYLNLKGAKLNNAKASVIYCTETDFSNAVLKGAELNSALLYRSSLNKADLSGANLELASMENINAIGANFSGVYAKGCKFEDSNLSNADFSNADLTVTNFVRSNIEGVNFTGAKGIPVEVSTFRRRFEGATWNDQTIFPEDFDRSILEVPEQ